MTQIMYLLSCTCGMIRDFLLQAAKFKKVKKKVRKIRAKKMLKADDLLPQNGSAYSGEDFGSR